MDFQPQMKYTLPTGVPIPFYMAYPGYTGVWQSDYPKENRMYQDLEYFRQTYPTKVRKYQRRVEEILDRMDYEGSMIYDEYPDRFAMQSLGLSVAKILENESQEEMGEAEKAMLEALAQVLVCNEICRRRQKNGK